jgi:negative regulator of sigma F NrsF-like protein
MKDDFDLHCIGDVPDPLVGLADLPVPPRRVVSVSPSPTRARVATTRTVALGAALLYEGAWLALMHKRDDLHTIAPLLLLVEVAVPIGVAVLALAAASPGEDGLGKPKARMIALTLMAPVLFMGATFVLSTVSAGDADAGSFWLHGLRCFAWTSLYSAGPMVLAAWAFRRAFVVAPAWRMAAVAMACGATGAATMSLVCSVGSAAHVLVGHGGVMFVAALVMAALGRRVGAE